MPLIPEEQLGRLRKAIHDHDSLRRIVRRIEHLHRIVFHAQELDRRFVRFSAEEILIADIVTRHDGSVDGIHFALRRAEEDGKDRERAISDFATYIHNYYTMPLGVVMLKDLFGPASHFVTPAAGRASPLYKPAAAEKST